MCLLTKLASLPMRRRDAMQSHWRPLRQLATYAPRPSTPWTLPPPTKLQCYAELNALDMDMMSTAKNQLDLGAQALFQSATCTHKDAVNTLNSLRKPHYECERSGRWGIRQNPGDDSNTMLYVNHLHHPGGSNDDSHPRINPPRE